MKRFLLSVSLLAASLMVATAETGGPDRILPCPAQVTIAAASIPCSEAEVKIGSKAFKKATSGLPDFARDAAAIRCSAARSSTIRALHIAASCSTFPDISATRISSSSRSKQWPKCASTACTCT